ncbi:MAG TPA: GNAT family N-acetyltransferase [Rubrobacter sp.]|nr:GNAT family N-acetyltransferase [Rubrobacter sp.]
MKAGERAVYRVRPAGMEDVEFLWDMLYEAACWRPEGPRPPKEEVFTTPELAHYVDGWGRPGDAAVIAFDPDDGAKVGAAWYRLMPPGDPGYGFVEAATPEISIAVVPDRRGTGAGEVLLGALMERARSEGFGSLSLSVEEDNQAIKLYRRAGFKELHLSDGALTMSADLKDAAATKPTLSLTVLDGRLAVCRLDVGAEIPSWATGASFFSVTRTEDELSIVCPEENVPENISQEKGWRALKLEGPFELSTVGILASVAEPLAAAGASIFAVSTFDTDYVLVRETQQDLAISTLREHGHEVREGG